MLQLHDISFTIDKDGEDFDLIHKASLAVHPGHFMAIVGPSGCGKTTLLKIIAGLYEETDGSIQWHGRDLAEDDDLEPSEVGYVPQFSIAYDHLTVEENVENAVRLRVRTRTRSEVRRITRSVLEKTGLIKIRDSFVKVLSGGQKRRLGLALELVSNPTLLLCDEVTSGLDPKSEREIVHLLHDLSESDDRIVVNVTHSLSNLELYDTVLVLYEGRVVYHGPPKTLEHYFSVESAEDIYPRLAKRSASNWHSSWLKHGDAYYNAYAPLEEEASDASDESPDSDAGSEPASDAPSASGPLPKKDRKKKKSRRNRDGADEDEDDYDDDDEDAYDEDDYDDEGEDDERDSGPAELPGRLAQFFVLVERRWKIFVRDRVHLFLTLAMLFGFPILVIIFGLDGIEPPKQLTQSRTGNVVEEITEHGEVAAQHLKTGSLISGLVMFQVILLTLMGSNNSAREVAGERLIYEKEKFGGLHASSYLMSKVFFLALLVLVQSIWMGVFVQFFVPQLPGDIVNRIVLLILVNGAMTFVCLGISSVMRSPEQSSLLSIYLVGFQLPLSGAILALPDKIEPVTRPFISAFWSWSGNLDTMSGGNYQQAIKRVTEDTTLQTYNICLFVLAIHVAVGLIVSYIGCKRHQWD